MVDGGGMQLLFMLVVALCAGIIAWLVAWPLISGEKDVEKRIESAASNRTRQRTRLAETESQQERRKEVTEKLKELESGQLKTKEKVSLRLRLQRAGLDISPNMFWVLSFICGGAFGLLVFLAFPGVHILASMMATFVGIFGIPRFILNKMIKRRQNKFTKEFANAIDVIVRGVKSGLPLGECLSIIARESPEPVAGEFKDLVEQQRVGVTFEEAAERMIRRMPLPEVKFFSIVVGIQSQAGGNLSEALGNLAGVLRARKMMAAKVAALSSEAKASAGILASLPIVVMIMVYLSTPDYISLLWTTTMGQFLLFVSAFWMSMGILMMRKMINFKY